MAYANDSDVQFSYSHLHTNTYPNTEPGALTAGNVTVSLLSTPTATRLRSYSTVALNATVGSTAAVISRDAVTDPQPPLHVQAAAEWEHHATTGKWDVKLCFVGIGLLDFFYFSLSMYRCYSRPS